MADQTPLNQQVSRLSGAPRGQGVPENVAENLLGLDEERGEKYKRQTQRQRLINQRMRALSSKNDSNGSARLPRNAKFQNKDEQKKERLDSVDIGKLLVVALFFDLISGIMSLIPFIGEVVKGVTTFPLATLTLYTMYKNRGIEFKDGKMLARFWGSILLKFIPIISILPEYTLNVVLVVTATKAEDKIKN